MNAKLLPHLSRSVSALVLAAMFAPGSLSAQTTSQQSTAEQCPDGSTPAEGQACPPGTVTGQGAPTIGAANELPTNGTVDEQDIVVTGSRIARRGRDTIEPILVLDSAQIETRGFSTLGQALNELPAFGVPGASPVGAGQSDFGPGQSFVDFLGLGSQRTLTLLNGRRFVSSNTASIFGPTAAGNQVDFNVFPTKLVDRIETVVAIGAPIYGSDAIAGTINILLKRNYQGIELDAQYGISSRGDAPDYRVRGIAGQNFAGGRGNVTVSAEYNKAEGLVFNDRAITRSGDFFADAIDPNSRFSQVITRDRRIPSISEFGIPLVGGADFGLDFPLSPAQSALFFDDSSFNFGVNGANNSQLRFDPAGNLIPIDFGVATGLPGDFNINFSGGNGFSLVPVSNLFTDSERYSFVGLGSYEFSDKFRVFAEAFYSSSEGRNAVAQPAYNSALFDAAGTRDGNLIIPISNPFLTTAARAAIVNSINNNPGSDLNLGITDVQDYFYLGRANTDLQSGESTGRVEIMRGVVGLAGSFEVLAGKQWQFEASANYGRSKTTGRVPSLNEQNFRNALNSVRDASGNIVCAPGTVNSPIATVSAVCAPFNPFGQQVSQAARDYITTIARPSSLNQQYDFIGSVSGPLVALPGGDLSFALGYEHRQESQRFNPGAFFFGGADADPATDENGDGDAGNDRSSFGRSVPIDPVFGKFNTDEVFGELNADLISPDNDVPFFHSLSIQTAARYVDHSIAGKDFTYTGGVRYQPIRDLGFRGAYTRSIRSPAITEAFNPSSSSFVFATDPCDRRELDNGPAPATRRANCAAAGVPADFSSLSNQRSFPGATVGNPNLDNEKADSITVGLVLTPSFLRGFSATIDYVDVKLKDVISAFSTDQVVSACYDSTEFPDNQFCDNLRRNASTAPPRDANQLSFVATSFFNSDQLRYKGVLADVDYRFGTPFLGEASRIGLGLSYQYLDTLVSRAGSGDAEVTFDGSIGFSKHKGVLTATYENQGFGLQVQGAYIGKALFDPDEAEDFRSVAGVGDVVFVNLSANYTIKESFSIRLTVDNILDQKPPSPSPVGGGVTTYFRGILGRYFRIGTSINF